MEKYNAKYNIASSIDKFNEPNPKRKSDQFHSTRVSYLTNDLKKPSDDMLVTGSGKSTKPQDPFKMKSKRKSKKKIAKQCESSDYYKKIKNTTFEKASRNSLTGSNSQKKPFVPHKSKMVKRKTSGNIFCNFEIRL